MSNKTIYTLQRINNITNLILNIWLAKDNLTGFVKVKFKNQLIKTNRVLIDYAS